MSKARSNQSGFSIVEVLLVIILVAAIAFVGVYAVHRHNKNKTTAKTSTTTSTSSSTSTTKTHTPQEAVTFVQNTYDTYLATVNQANSDPSRTQPVAQVGLTKVKDSLTSDLYAKAAAVTQATPFSCTAQYVTDKYTASLSSSDATSAKIAVSISNGDGLHTDGMIATVDLTSLKITSIVCPS